MKKYSLDKLKIILSDRIGEPEVTIKFKNVNSQYMIIKYKDYYTFQRCGINDDSGEICFKSFYLLINTNTIDNINLKRDWNNIEEILIDEVPMEEL